MNKYLFFLTVIISSATVNIVLAELRPDREEILYRYNIAENASDLAEIRKKFGEALQSGDVVYSFRTSKEVVDKLDSIGEQLDEIHVPEKMIHPFNAFLESVKAYRKSATCIRNATEMILGYFEGTEKEINELIERGEDYANEGNRYFNLSMSLHMKLFGGEGNFEEFEFPDKEDRELSPAFPETFPNNEKLTI